jgi:hypothetical protein
MLMIIVLAAIVIIAAILIFAATKPDTFRVERSADIKASPEQVFAQINDLHNWRAWSTWEKMDPNMKKTFSGSAQGKGAAYAWEGNSKVGKGKMEITESIPYSKVQLKLDFIAPFEGHNMADLDLQAQGAGTHIIWGMHGPAPFLSKLFSVFVNMDRMIGKDFEDSLANLKAILEK